MPLTLCMPDEPFWTELLLRMRTRKVIPVVGEGAITYKGDADELLYPLLAKELATKAHGKILPDQLVPKTVNEVVRGFEGASKEEFTRQIDLLRMNLQDTIQQIQPDGPARAASHPTAWRGCSVARGQNLPRQSGR